MIDYFGYSEELTSYKFDSLLYYNFESICYFASSFYSLSSYYKWLIYFISISIYCFYVSIYFFKALYSEILITIYASFRWLRAEIVEEESDLF